MPIPSNVFCDQKLPNINKKYLDLSNFFNV